ncbi:MAG: hypothetical protein E7062_03670 [Spirochaetaceae bacterium]|nr:hypothetical protein [Spirochaetaceae bacterium]
MKYSFTIRLMSSDATLLQEVYEKNKEISKLFFKGQPIRTNSKICAIENVLLFNKITVNEIDVKTEKKILELLDCIPESFNIRKEIVCGTICEQEQFGFELSPRFISILGEKNFYLSISGVFI